MILSQRKAFICGLKGQFLTKKEISFLKENKPWGIILFSRNIKNLNQIQKLVTDIKKLFSDKDYPILIDEEGGKISRLRKFIDNSSFSAKYFGDLYTNDKKKFMLYFNVYIKQISYLLRLIGININTVPVLDLSIKGSNKIIGSRSFSSNKQKVSYIGDFCIELFKKNRIANVIKHIPGHGLAKVDSHKKLPVINKDLKYLLKNDFYTFKNKNTLFAMTAHILYRKIDPKNCCTHSKKIIKIIRKNIKFKNLILSDDISMKALKNSISINTRKAFLSGCNIVLHCNGNLAEMKEVANNSPLVNNFILRKTYQFKKIIR